MLLKGAVKTDSPLFSLVIVEMICFDRRTAAILVCNDERNLERARNIPMGVARGEGIRLSFSYILSSAPASRCKLQYIG